MMFEKLVLEVSGRACRGSPILKKRENSAVPSTTLDAERIVRLRRQGIARLMATWIVRNRLQWRRRSTMPVRC